MGLEIVELIMAIEDEFGIEIPDTEAGRLAVLGDMHDFVVHTLQQRGNTLDDAQVWERLSKLVVTQLGVRPEQVTRTAHLVHDLHAD